MRHSSIFTNPLITQVFPFTKAFGPSTSPSTSLSILDTVTTIHRTGIHTAAARHQFSSGSHHHRSFSLAAAHYSSRAAVNVAAGGATVKEVTRNGGGGGSGRTGWSRYLLVVPPLIAASLGKWQLDRRQWKIDLLERRNRIMKVINM